jgi:NADH-quinone oxidoreductase subunit L
MVPLSYYLVLSGFLFACGVLGFLIKRNIITIFMSIELMLNGVNLSFVAFAAHWHALAGQVFVFFVMVVAAAEAAVGLAIIIAVYRTRETLNIDQVNSAQTMTSSLNLWLIPSCRWRAPPSTAFSGRSLRAPRSAWSDYFFSGAAFAWALSVVARFSADASLPGILAHWIRSGSFTADFAFYLDQLSLVMLLVVTGVGFLIHIYSVGYMWDDPSYYRFFAYLNLFMFFMLTLVLASNYLLMFIGWEGVGLASYLLIGFWFTKDSAASAGKKAFIVNRIGDFGFLIALFLIIQHFGSLNFTQVFAQVQPIAPETAGAGLLTAIGILLMVGACGKSAQIPLYVWLPDAMEGPTPVSALIHAATMVTAGVYMVSRSHVIFERAPMA